MTNKPVKANKEIAELFWAFHRARLDDPSIKEMKPYIQPILDLMKKEFTKGYLEGSNDIREQYKRYMREGRQE